MKKLFLVLAAVVLTTSASAQGKEVVTAHKTFDNWYFGINAGAATPMQKWGDAGFMKGFAPSAGLRLGKNFTTSFGVAIDANAYFEANEKSLMQTRTFIDAINVDAMGTLNLSSFFGGYLGKPRRVELIALGGFGWMHQFGALPRAKGCPRFGLQSWCQSCCAALSRACCHLRSVGQWTYGQCSEPS